ncbi:nephrin-like [Penaeus japonicus]|uniref:nephrin-like n=1 Tax=Penaeus japonicus TaxID=27405 RepID=UPI001C712CEC|nr:nephrin-like [Penaeus japonicus]
MTRNTVSVLGALLIALTCLPSTSADSSDPDQNGLEESPLTVVHAVESGRVLLPCHVAPPVPTDETILILFYHGAIGTPIFSIDGRNGPIKRAPHWADEATLGSRAYFDMASDPPGLVLNPVKASDDAEYRCRVDFRSSPTQNVRVQLEVIVPPKRIRIKSEVGMEVSGVIGPYPVGASVSLVCEVESGRPRPSVSWFHEGSLLDDDSEVKQGEITTNRLTIAALTRADLYRVLTCQASNSNLSTPVAAAVTLDMSFPPLDVRILGSMESLSEGERYEIVCESSGSRPTATISWWKNGMLMTDTKSEVFHEGNVSRYTPRLTLAPGQNLDMEDIEESDDVYFECGIQANPRVYKVQWFHNGDELNHNVSAGIIQSNQSLVLQKVSRRSSGQYTCSATNLHGTGGSNAVQLSVKFAPLCRAGQKVIYGGGKHEEINVTCSVEAHPEPKSFRWAFNTSSEMVDIPSSRIWVVGKGRSQASYTPRTHLDYGSLLCWANNDVGRQQQPCIFHIIHAASPEPVNNCTVENVSSTGASIRCLAGWNGGLDQTFTLSVTHARAHTRAHDKKEAPRVLANTSTSPKPEFTLSGLEPGTEYVLTIMGVNKKGQSEPVRMAIFTLKDVAEKRTSPGAGTLALTPILAVLLGVLASLLLMALVIVLVVRSRRPRPRSAEVKMVYDKGSAAAPLRAHHDESSSGDDQNPDIIPVNDDHQVKDLRQDFPSEPLAIDEQHHHQQQEQQQQQSSPPQQKQPQSQHQQPQQQPQQQQQQQQQQQVKEYLGGDGSFYINPGTLLRQKGVMLPRETDPLLLVGCPLAASTPTARSTQPSVYAHFSPDQPGLPPSYVPELSTATLPKAFPRDLPSDLPYPTHDLTLSSLLPPYSHHSYTLGRNGSLSSGRATPSCSSSASSTNHHGSASTVAFHPESDSPRAPLVTPRDKTSSPNHRESSV